MGYGPVVNGKQMPITPWKGSWAATVNNPRPNPPTTIYIAPAVGESHHPQCRIYATNEVIEAPATARSHYAAYPSRWREVGLMNYQGKLVCFLGQTDQYLELKSCEPLAAGLTFKFD